MIDPDVAMTYLTFVAERHRVWEKRQQGEEYPWTDDPLLASYKFTNVYRVLDHGSQFLMKELLDPNLNARDTLARCFLYRYSNLPSTWIAVREALGGYPIADDLNPVLCDVLIQHREAGHKVFSGAYVILPQPNRTGDKVVQAVRLAADFMRDHADDFLAATSQRQRYDVMRNLYGVGPFLAMQILTDYGYSVHGATDVEDEFVVPGPGCEKGAKFIDPVAKPYDTLMWAVNAVRAQPDCPQLKTGVGHYRPPSWMDVQNTLCEFSKYHRFAAKPLRVKPYVPAHPGPQPEPMLPLHW